jgi:hypothetical protein
MDYKNKYLKYKKKYLELKQYGGNPKCEEKENCYIRPYHSIAEFDTKEIESLNHIVVPMNAYHVVDKDDKNILTTTGVQDCIAVMIYNPDHGRYLGHFLRYNDFEEEVSNACNPNDPVVSERSKCDVVNDKKEKNIYAENNKFLDVGKQCVDSLSNSTLQTYVKGSTKINKSLPTWINNEKTVIHLINQGVIPYIEKRFEQLKKYAPLPQYYIYIQQGYQYRWIIDETNKLNIIKTQEEYDAYFKNISNYLYKQKTIQIESKEGGKLIREIKIMKPFNEPFPNSSEIKSEYKFDKETQVYFDPYVSTDNLFGLQYDPDLFTKKEDKYIPYVGPDVVIYSIFGIKPNGQPFGIFTKWLKDNKYIKFYESIPINKISSPNINKRCIMPYAVSMELGTKLCKYLLDAYREYIGKFVVDKSNSNNENEFKDYKDDYTKYKGKLYSKYREDFYKFMEIENEKKR